MALPCHGIARRFCLRSRICKELRRMVGQAQGRNNRRALRRMLVPRHYHCPQSGHPVNVARMKRSGIRGFTRHTLYRPPLYRYPPSLADGIYPLPRRDETSNGAIAPLMYLPNPAMLDRITLCMDARVSRAQDAQERLMYVIHAPLQISLVAYRVLPIAPLP